MSTSKIVMRIKQIQNSIEQARTMLESMEQFKHLIVRTTSYLYLASFRGFFSSRVRMNKNKNFIRLLPISKNNKRVTPIFSI